MLEDLQSFRELARGRIASPANAPRKTPGAVEVDLPTRFWAKVDRRGSDECWPWTAALDDKGYGRIRWQGRMHIAPRVAYRLSCGDPGGLHVLHACDNPICVNPAHLSAGTQSQNMRDCAARRRLNVQRAKGPAVVRAITAARHGRQNPSRTQGSAQGSAHTA